MFKTFGYRFIIGPTNPLVKVHSLGHQLQNSSDYYFDCMKRPDEAGHCIFQYTLAGRGRIEINGKSHDLKRGRAFITTIPSQSCYYLPEDSHHWEFLFITLTGGYASTQWQLLQQAYGSIIKLQHNDAVIRFLQTTYTQAENDQISDGYQASALAYEFIMRLSRSLKAQPAINELEQNEFSIALTFMQDNLSQAISLEDIATAINMSKYHFNRSFTKSMGTSPWNYLTKLRLEQAVRLLVSTDLSISDIAQQVGYSSANYFSKVFRKYIGMTPRTAREHYQGIDDFRINL